MMTLKDQTPEEKEAGLIRIGEIYQSIDSAHAEIYVRVQHPGGAVIAYRFMRPETLWSKILRYCTDLREVTNIREREL